MISPPTLRCACRRPRCPREDCLLCSRCGCGHDGRSIEEKLQRGRGRPKRLVDTSEFQQVTSRPHARQTQHVRPVPREDERPVRVRPVEGAYAFPPTPLDAAPLKYQDVMRFLGFAEEDIQYLRKNVGPKAMRQSTQMWDAREGGDGEKYRATVLNMYSRALMKIAVATCGEEAASASVSAYDRRCGTKLSTSKGAPRASTSTRKQKPKHLGDIAPLTSAFAATKKGSIERRTLRAVAAEMVSWSKWRSIAGDAPGAYFSRESHGVGLRDFQLLFEERRLVKETWSRSKFDREVGDKAIQFSSCPSRTSPICCGAPRASFWRENATTCLRFCGRCRLLRCSTTTTSSFRLKHGWHERHSTASVVCSPTAMSSRERLLTTCRGSC